ncbi:hypothetical protein PACTADRAFT_47049 [Pachysolen tannophilus NRRL Y-2460]|uniref:Amino acid transporter transmembrane domain-containing protein n=1 Tax=Pachysolen tannophilus NRRL Y-2460 TaxID=669874 RepID=A0A1E4TN58_PACTA|nr:hypothetical protein PACTADRAFT_47049 [Pachysolen tannophilus NRRL Y-2460]
MSVTTTSTTTGTATARSASINLLNTIIGSGMLAMSYGIKANGIILGIFVILFSALTSSFGLYLQSKCSKYVKEGHSSFFALSQLTYPSLSIIFDLAIAIKCFGVGISYLVVIGDLMPRIMETMVITDIVSNSNSYLLNRNFWITCFMIIVVPLSFLKKLDSLKYASMVALSSVGYLIILVFVHFCERDIKDKGPIRIIEPQSFTKIISAFPIFVFGYTCHQNMFSLINELEDKSSKNINKVIQTSIGIAALSYVLVGLTGYITFGDNVGGNIIVMYPQSVSSTVGRIAIVILVTLSYPLQCHPCRASANHVFHYIKAVYINNNKSNKNFLQKINNNHFVDQTNGSVSTEPTELAQEENISTELLHIVPLETPRFIILTTLILIASYLLAISVSSLEHVLAFVGSTGSTSISFILPGIFGYKLIGSEKQPNEELTLFQRCLKWGSLALAAWGLIVMIVCLSATIFLGAGH